MTTTPEGQPEAGQDPQRTADRPLVSTAAEAAIVATGPADLAVLCSTGGQAALPAVLLSVLMVAGTWSVLATQAVARRNWRGRPRR